MEGRWCLQQGEIVSKIKSPYLNPKAFQSFHLRKQSEAKESKAGVTVKNDTNNQGGASDL